MVESDASEIFKLHRPFNRVHDKTYVIVVAPNSVRTEHPKRPATLTVISVGAINHLYAGLFNIVSHTGIIAALIFQSAQRGPSKKIIS